MPNRIYVRKCFASGDWIEHLGGVGWFDAPPPHRLHRCRPQTRGCFNWGLVERSACGSIRLDGSGSWMDRNTSHA